MGPYNTPFLLTLGIAYFSCAALQLRILRRSLHLLERSLFRRLLPFFLLIPIVNFYVFEWGGSRILAAGDLLVLLALMASLFPTFVVAYSITAINSYKLRSIAVWPGRC